MTQQNNILDTINLYNIFLPIFKEKHIVIDILNMKNDMELIDIPKLSELEQLVNSELENRFFLNPEQIEKLKWKNTRRILNHIKEMIKVADFVAGLSYLRQVHEDDKDDVYRILGHILIFHSESWCYEDICLNMEDIIRTFNNDYLNIFTRITKMFSVMIEDI